jgi:hypothetical protein
MRIITIPFLVISLSCNGQIKKHFRGYYFPVKSFLKERTYCFVNQMDTADKSFWKMKTMITGKDTLFQTIIYNNHILTEKIIEQIDNGNSKMLSYMRYERDKPLPCKVVDSVVYKVDQVKNEIIRWKVTFQDNNSPSKISLTKARRLQSVNNQKQTFIDKMNVHILGTSEKYEYTVQFVYEKGKGLISYKIMQSDNPIKDYRLIEIK